ncbi:MAG TPA: hypothetical protein PKA63_07595 [Oligoflexia bacterium]|nr:hypothetical protein [Oligoflexia bacterium]HMP48513.1 hypothetical protein [Oligoflexia bacterium]
MPREYLNNISQPIIKDNSFKIETLYKNRGIFIYSDPGGAKPVCSLALELSNYLNEFRVFSDREYAFLKIFKINPVKPPSIFKMEILNFKPDFVFTGTSYKSTLERQFVREAKSLGVPTYSFVDHSMEIKNRFLLEGEYIYPDYILVSDNDIFNAAIYEGVSEEQLKIFPNPYLESLKAKKWHPHKSKIEVLLEYGIPLDNRKIVLYAPDPISNISGLKVKSGFDEFTATKSFLPLFNQYSETHHFVLAPHPNQNLPLLLSCLNNTPVTVLPSGMDLIPLVHYCDIVLGFFSNILTEATIIGPQVLRYIVNRENDPLKDKEIGTLVNEESMACFFNS